MRKLVLPVLVGAVLLTLATGVAAQDRGKFECLGPGGGGGIFNAAASPHDPNLIFVSCDMSGFYRSTDGGRSWSMLDKRQMRDTVRAKPVFDPVDPNVVYAYGIGELRVSRDKGLTWRKLTEDQPWARDAVVELGIGTSGKVLLAGTASASYLSTDRGKTWAKCPGVEGPAVGFHVESETVLFVATSPGVFRSDDGGKTWTEKSGALPWRDLRDFCGATDANTKRTVLFSAIPSKAVNGKFEGGVYRSEDRGETWQSVMGAGINTTLGKQLYGRSDIAQYQHVQMAQNDADVVYCTTAGTGYLPPYHWTVYRSADRGKTWQSCFYWDSRGAAQDNVEPSWLDLDFSWGWGGPALTFSVNAGNPNQAFYTNTGELWITEDAGKTWRCGHSQPAKGQRVKGVAWTGNGLEVTVVHDVAFDPFDPNRIYGGWSDIGFLRSEDGGRSWFLSSTGSPWQNTFYEILPDPARKGVLYAAASNHHGIPAWPYVERMGPTGGVAMSTDSGVTWKKISDDIPESPATSIVMDPTSPPDARVLYVAVADQGVYKSVDGGKSWVMKSKGLPTDNKRVYQLKRFRDGTLFVSITAKRQGMTFPVLGGLYKSTDKGESWTSITQSVTIHWPAGFDVHPTDPNTIYLTASTIPGAAEGGLYKTTDGGKSWKHLELNFDTSLQGYIHAYAVLVDPQRPDRVYLSTGSHGLLISNDAGQTWQEVKGVPFTGVLKTVLDPRVPGRIWAGTYGGGIWRGTPAEAQ